MFAGELEVAANEDEHAAGGARGLAIDGGDGVLALLEREAGEFGYDVLGAHYFLTFEGKHGCLLVKVCQSRSIRIESRVVVLHESLRHRIWIHPPPPPLLALPPAAAVMISTHSAYY